MNQEKENEKTVTVSIENIPEPKKIYKNQELYKIPID